MKKIYCFFLILIYCSAGYSQDEDYVINKPTDKTDKYTTSTPNPDFTNYSLTASAYTLKKKTFRLANTDIIFNKVSYGLTDNTTLSLNLSFIGTFALAAKHQFHINDHLKLGVSGSAGQLFAIDEDTIINFVGGQTMITFGDIQDNFTAGTGYYYADGSYEVFNNETELKLSNVFIGTQKQIGRKSYLIIDGIYFVNYNVFSGAIALKFIIKSSMSLTFGVMPIGWNGSQSAGIKGETSVLPLISFRMMLD
jgi:hypothetical protein